MKALHFYAGPRRPCLVALRLGVRVSTRTPPIAPSPQHGRPAGARRTSGPLRPHDLDARPWLADCSAPAASPSPSSACRFRRWSPDKDRRRTGSRRCTSRWGRCSISLIGMHTAAALAHHYAFNDNTLDAHATGRTVLQPDCRSQQQAPFDSDVSVPSAMRTTWPPMRTPSSSPRSTVMTSLMVLGRPISRPCSTLRLCVPSVNPSKACKTRAKPTAAEPVAGSSGMPKIGREHAGVEGGRGAHALARVHVTPSMPRSVNDCAQ